MNIELYFYKESEWNIFKCFKGGILNWCKFSIIEYSCHWVSSKGNLDYALILFFIFIKKIILKGLNEQPFINLKLPTSAIFKLQRLDIRSLVQTFYDFCFENRVTSTKELANSIQIYINIFFDYTQ